MVHINVNSYDVLIISNNFKPLGKELDELYNNLNINLQICR